MNAIDFLIDEHNKVRKSLKEISNQHHSPAKKKLFEKLCQDLLRHEKMEETIWYPKLKNNPKLFDEIKHLIKEENHAEKVINELKQMTDSQRWERKFIKFKSDVEHHALEEENQLFPKVKNFYKEEELSKIGKEMVTFAK